MTPCRVTADVCVRVGFVNCFVFVECGILGVFWFCLFLVRSPVREMSEDPGLVAW